MTGSRALRCEVHENRTVGCEHGLWQGVAGAEGDLDNLVIRPPTLLDDLGREDHAQKWTRRPLG
jgi:hypothetical protein